MKTFEFDKKVLLFGMFSHNDTDISHMNSLLPLQKKYDFKLGTFFENGAIGNPLLPAHRPILSNDEMQLIVRLGLNIVEISGFNKKIDDSAFFEICDDVLSLLIEMPSFGINRIALNGTVGVFGADSHKKLYDKFSNTIDVFDSENREWGIQELRRVKSAAIEESTNVLFNIAEVGSASKNAEAEPSIIIHYDLNTFPEVQNYRFAKEHVIGYLKECMNNKKLLINEISK